MTIENEQIIGTPLAGLTYVFLSFASFTDGERTQEELEAAADECLVYAKHWKVTKEEYMQAYDDAHTMLDGCETYEQEKDLFIDILNMLKKQEFWNETYSKAMVGGLTRLMNADGEQSEGELFWLNHIKEGWKVS
jgi:hypothetical protein